MKTWHSLVEHNCGNISLLFADDVALVSHTTVGLQNQLNVLARASAKMGLKVNLDKTKIMVLRKGGTLQRTKNGSQTANA